MTRLTKSALLLLLCVISPAGITKDDNSATLDNNTFAIINGEQISAATFLSTLNSGMRQRFYHGNIPAEQLTAFRKEVAAKMVEGLLLLQEARHSNLEPDHKMVEAQLANYERRYADSAQWRTRREQLLPGLRTQLENQSLLQSITAKLKKVEPPSEVALQNYYQQNPDKFTTPQKRKVSLILLKIDPSSPSSVWESAHSEATQLVTKIKGGASFAELAKIHSGDPQSAAAGGDMGFLHQGMLAAEAELVLDKLAIGDVSDPVTTLQGIVILRLDDISPAQLNGFAQVKERASGLLQRELSEHNYQQRLQELRSRATIQVNSALVQQEYAGDR